MVIFDISNDHTIQKEIVLRILWEPKNALIDPPPLRLEATCNSIGTHLDLIFDKKYFFWSSLLSLKVCAHSFSAPCINRRRQMDSTRVECL